MTVTKVLKSFDQEFFEREGRRRCVLGDEQPLTMWFRELPLAGIHTFTRLGSLESETLAFGCLVSPIFGYHSSPVYIRIFFYADHIVVYAGGKIRKVAIDESITQLPPYIEFDCPFGTGPEIYFINLYDDGDQAASISPS